MSRPVLSSWLDRRILLSSAAGYAIQYASFIALNFRLDLAAAHAVSDRFAEVLGRFGIQPEVVAVKRIR